MKESASFIESLCSPILQCLSADEEGYMPLLQLISGIRHMDHRLIRVLYLPYRIFFGTLQRPKMFKTNTSYKSTRFLGISGNVGVCHEDPITSSMLLVKSHDQNVIHQLISVYVFHIGWR